MYMAATSLYGTASDERGPLPGLTAPFAEPYSSSMKSRSLRLVRMAIQLGWRGGLVLGGAWVTYTLINTLVPLDATGYGLLNHGILVAMIAIFLWLGFRGAYRTGRWETGALTAAGTSLVGSVIAIVALWVVTYLFLDAIRHNPFMIGDFHRSGMRDMDAFIVDDNLVPTFIGPWLSLGVAAVAGGLGAAIGKGFSGPGARPGTVLGASPRT